MRINFSKSQAKTLRSTLKNKFTLYSAGIGSGKTFIGSYYVRDQIARSPKANGFIAANTYKQLQTATLATLFIELDKWNMPYSYNKQTGILNILGRTIYCYSLDNYNAIRGIEIGWGWLDETRDTREDAFKVVMGRLRDKHSTNLNLLLTSSPSGFNWLYEYFAGDKKTELFNMVNGSSYENRHLPEGYVDSLKSSYDERVFEQEVMGQFVNITSGQIYYAFSRKENVKKITPMGDQSLIIGMDFNINPMSAVVCQVYDNTIHVIDEFMVQTSDTREVAKLIAEKYGTGHRIIPDSTGKRTQTSSAGWSDHAILTDEGFKVMSTRNPFRIDRYNCVNNLLEKKRLVISSNCKKTIKDLEQVSYKEGGNQPDTTKDSSLTHISDALGYVAWFTYPIQKRKSSATLVPR